MFTGNLLIQVCAHCHLSWHWAPLSSACLWALCTLPPDIYGHWWDPPEPPLLQDEQTQLFQLLLTAEVLQSFHYLDGPSFDSLQHVHVSLLSEGPELDSAIQMWPDQSWGEGKDHLLWSDDNALQNAARNTVCLLRGRGILLTCVQEHCWLMFVCPSGPPGPSLQSSSPLRTPTVFSKYLLIYKKGILHDFSKLLKFNLH